MTVSEAIGHVVYEARASRNMSQTALAYKMGISQRTYVSKVENSFTVPGVDSLVNIAQALGTSGSDLLEKAERFARAVNEGHIVFNTAKRSSKAGKVVILPRSAVDPAAIARRRKLAEAIGTLPVEGVA